MKNLSIVWIILLIAFASSCELLKTQEMDPAKQTEMDSSTGEESAPDRD